MVAVSQNIMEMSAGRVLSSDHFNDFSISKKNGSLLLKDY